MYLYLLKFRFSAKDRERKNNHDSIAQRINIFPNNNLLLLFWACLVAQMVKNLSAVQETQV